MARLQFMIGALGAATLLLLLTFQRTANFGAEAASSSWQIPECLSFLRTWTSPASKTDYSHASLRHGRPNVISHMDKASNATTYLLGVGKADITGPVVELNMMGYADTNQIGSGLRQRIYTRAFIIADSETPNDRFVYVVMDTQSGDTAVRYGILNALAAMGPEFAVYGQHNVAITGTHSHSGPGAWLNYLLPQITSKGFDKQSYQAIVDGAVLSIVRAHESQVLGTLSFGSIDLEDANISRSPYAYLANPEEERAKYTSDVEKTMTMLRFTRAGDGLELGVLTWFPVHGTSLLENNTLIAGDNKGVAASLFEKSMIGTDNASPTFVAGFSQANVGDTSPNTLGAWCEDGSGEMCDFQDSTCKGISQTCHGRGPGFRVSDEGATSCYEIGSKQFNAAQTLFNQLVSGDGNPISGSAVTALHSFEDFSNFAFTLPNGTIAKTCPAALGYSFAAGTTDGPGAFDFKQNDTKTPNANPLWIVVRDFLKDPSPEQEACQYPKPILLDVGEITKPYLWTPNIVDIQLLRVGQLIIIVSPGEATTMSGRRWKEAVAAQVSASSMTGSDEPLVVLGGPANSYTHYLATEEEYGVQRYEGASTLYGPHSLNAYINLTLTYLPYLFTTASSPVAPPPQGPFPPDYVNISLSFIEGVVFDSAGFTHKFGDVLTDAPPTIPKGQKLTVVFVGANPRNDLRLEKSYAAVERQSSTGSWEIFRDDSDWDLIFRWTRTSTVLATSQVSIEWENGAKNQDVDSGDRFRVHYWGASKSIGGLITQFEGISGSFVVI
ncbi:hypothetical protein MMC25_003711 [Agyrium rufum]|nr:hypothetical protein [Agyrium rufum]